LYNLQLVVHFASKGGLRGDVPDQRFFFRTANRTAEHDASVDRYNFNVLRAERQALSIQYGPTNPGCNLQVARIIGLIDRRQGLVSAVAGVAGGIVTLASARSDIGVTSR